ncbi:siderophore-interacting protein [Marinivivus vitaminiproducens]|uniref:siderophore-interacting protein n=1 Tax=Marinivivus vitaminiproducens TaxID=3035935 RepID=UPI00279D4B0F|nr:siderophore-interacting protein [Geminicoccaceae bacterium SCSIO 64248]
MTTPPPALRQLRVLSVRDVTPGMRRITFEGRDLERYATDSHLHCRLLIDRRGGEPAWPWLDEDGQVTWPDEERPAMRKYTIRRIDPDAGRLDIDFVLHGDHGVGSAFAARAASGDVIGMVGPGGKGVGAAPAYLLAGDETALPAIGRILESMDGTARGFAFIEVAGERDIQDLRVPGGITIRWLPRDGAAAGTTRLLEDAVVACTSEHGVEDTFIWAGTEFDAFRAIRSHVRDALGVPNERHHVVSYWRRGVADH